MKMMRWFLLALIPVALFVMGCDDSGSGSSDDYREYTFINDTGDEIHVYRDGGVEWEGDDDFNLKDRGDEHTVRLEHTGEIKYRWMNLNSGEIDIEESGNQIFFKEG
ncbi:MAG: hypothetical protein EOM20_03745 [Spartobacteria bacterium]|nr:hypothetical protein [Spartobacteria bacterium]